MLLDEYFMPKSASIRPHAKSKNTPAHDTLRLWFLSAEYPTSINFNPKFIPYNCYHHIPHITIQTFY